MLRVLSLLLVVGAVLHWTVEAAAQRGDRDQQDQVPTLSRLQDAKPGETALLKSAEGMDYFFRLPKKFDPEAGARLIVFLHGSNMNGLSYLRSFEARKWCVDDILLCPNGEQNGDDPYGANNFGFGSAKPVSALTQEVQNAFKTTLTYIGGHSQGGFVTYSAILHDPELYQGAFPMAGDCWMQNEPNLWEKEPEKLALQKKIPIAIIHGREDPVVSFSQGQHANDCFMAACYPKLRFFAPEKLGHQFMLSPVDDAIDWLDAMHGVNPVETMKLAERWAKEHQWGWALQAALAVAGQPDADESSRKTAESLLARGEELAAVAASEISAKIKADSSGNWIDEWFAFHHQFGATQSAEKLVGYYQQRRSEQREAAETLFYEAYKLIRDDKTKSDAYIKLEQLLKDYPCTYHAFYAKDWLDNRKDKPPEEKFR